MSAETAPRMERRQIRFGSIDEALAEAERLAQAEREGRLHRVGNWKLGQALAHLATWADFAQDGYPPQVRAPLLVRMLLRLMRRRILTKGMFPGVKIRNISGGTLGAEPCDADEGLARFRAAMERLGASAPSIPNPIFGSLAHEQWIQLNLRHAELHLSFQCPREQR
ncbi:MAG TPA: DUF1569 domain-containing protein [Tepidisphaeraceae bacterium]|nr:DUF1569 domain-containing protein [Tepidisphaeraceae bacterium]